MYRKRITRERREEFASLIGKVVRVEADAWERVGVIERINACDVHLYGPQGDDLAFCTSYDGPFLVTTVEDRWTGPGPEPEPTF